MCLIPKPRSPGDSGFVSGGGSSELDAAWSIATVETRVQFLRDLAGGKDWLSEICAVACEQRPGFGAALGRRATEDLRGAWQRTSPEDHRQFLCGLFDYCGGSDAHAAPPPARP